MIKIYHNPRCSKSRTGLQYLESKALEISVIKYLDEGVTADELKTLLKQLNYSPIELVRTNEAIWKEQFKGKELSDDQIIEAMVNHPKLIERPIIIKGEKAVVARPTEKIDEIL